MICISIFSQQNSDCFASPRMEDTERACKGTLCMHQFPVFLVENNFPFQTRTKIEKKILFSAGERLEMASKEVALPISGRTISLATTFDDVLKGTQLETNDELQGHLKVRIGNV